MNSLFFSRVTGRENVSHKSPVVAKQDGRIIYRDNKTIHCGLELQNRFGSFELLPSAFSNPPRLGRNDMACATCDVLVRDQSAPSKAQSRHGMRAIFLIHLKQVIRDKDWVYPLFLLLLCTLLGQYFAPTDDDPTLIYSTRTQSIWRDPAAIEAPLLYRICSGRSGRTSISRISLPVSPFPGARCR